MRENSPGTTGVSKYLAKQAVAISGLEILPVNTDDEKSLEGQLILASETPSATGVEKYMEKTGSFS